MGKHNEDSYAQHHNGFRPDALFWTHGRGSDVMQPIAIPSVGGLAVSLPVSIFIAPCLFCAVEKWKWKRAQQLPAKRPIVMPIIMMSQNMSPVIASKRNSEVLK